MNTGIFDAHNPRPIIHALLQACDPETPLAIELQTDR